MKTGLIVLWFFTLCSVSQGQEYFTTTRMIDVEQGLTHYRIMALHASQGGMWIGTGDGLNYYDGYQWKYWRKESGTLNTESINFIHQDQKNNLWLFNTKKIDQRDQILYLDILKPNQEKSVSIQEHFGDELPFRIEDIQYFTQDKEQRLYFQVNNKLWRYSSTNSFELVSMPEGFVPNTIFDDGSYLGNLNGQLAIVSTDGSVAQQFDYPLNDFFYTINGDSNRFLFAHPYQTWTRFEKSPSGTYSRQPFPFQNSNTHELRLLHYDKSRNCNIVSSNTNTFLFDENDEVIATKDFSSRVAVNDPHGNIWTGKHNINILRLEETKFERYLFQDEDKVSFSELHRCRGIIQSEGQLLINTYNGQKRIKLETGELIQSGTQSNTRYFPFLKTKSGDLWTAYKSLKQCSGPALEKEKNNSEKLKHFRTWSLFEDHNERIWMGASGLFYLEDGAIQAFDKYNEFEELTTATILSFFKEKNGVIWIVSNLGLYLLDLEKGIVQRFNKDNTNLPTKKFQHMYQDEQGVFWLATEDAGLISWNKATGQINRFDKNFGLPSNNIYSIYEDDFGYLWLSSFNGIIRFHKHLQTFEVFHEADGTSGNEFNRISHYQAEDGQIYFGGQNGVTGFHPKNFVGKESTEEKFSLSVKHTSIFARHVIKDTLADGQAIDLKHLPPGTRVIDFEIEGSDIFWTDKIDLHYSLTQLDKNGQQLSNSKENISSNNRIELFGMYPGIYELHIKALQKNGKQVGKALNISLAIASPLTHSPLFWVSLILMACMGIFLFHKVKMARLKKRKAELEVLIVQKAKKIVEDQKIIELQAEQITNMKGQLNRKDENLLAQFKTIIQERLGDPDLYLPAIIDDLDISRSNFYEKVKAITGLTPNQYILEMRLNQAKELLESGSTKTVKEVSNTVGFRRPAYFSKLFKERFGMKPSMYFRVPS